MRTNDHNNQLKRTLGYLALAACLGVTAMGLTQCRLVDDTVVGVQLESEAVKAKTDCIKKCQAAYKKAKDAENDRHKKAYKACKDKKCKDAEKERHKANSKKLSDQQKTCKKSCYNEGNGKGGR